MIWLSIRIWRGGWRKAQPTFSLAALCCKDLIQFCPFFSFQYKYIYGVYAVHMHIQRSHIRSWPSLAVMLLVANIESVKPAWHTKYEILLVGCITAKHQYNNYRAICVWFGCPYGSKEAGGGKHSPHKHRQEEYTIHWKIDPGTFLSILSCSFLLENRKRKRGRV